MEIAMTDYIVVKWVHDMVKVGFFGEKKVREGLKGNGVGVLLVAKH
jgi:hypothetical protein